MTIAMLEKLSVDELQRIACSGHKCASLARIVLTTRSL